MKKYISLICILLVAVGLVACNISAEKQNEHKKPDIFGYILDKSGQSIFVVSKDAEDFSDNDGVDEYYDAIWLSDAPKNLKIGQLVKVWYDGPIQESYPAGGKVGEIEVVTVANTKGAILKETEALKKAVEIRKPNGNLAVRSIEFDKVEKTWEIEWKQIPYGDGLTTEVNDE